MINSPGIDFEDDWKTSALVQIGDRLVHKGLFGVFSRKTVFSLEKISTESLE